MESMPTMKIIVDEEVVLKFAQQEVKRVLADFQVGTWWDMKRLEAETSRKRDWLLDNVLLNPIFREEMTCIANKGENGRWLFRGEAMRNFLDENFHRLNSGKRSGGV